MCIRDRAAGGERRAAVLADQQDAPKVQADRCGLQAITVNANSYASLTKHLATRTADVALAQEVHAQGAKMHEVQGDALDVGWKGQWIDATPTGEGGSEGGLAVLARSCIQ
eukprot:5119286-Pyramimonas_sp.AAC.1